VQESCDGILGCPENVFDEKQGILDEMFDHFPSLKRGVFL